MSDILLQAIPTFHMAVNNIASIVAISEVHIS